MFVHLTNLRVKRCVATGAILQVGEDLVQSRSVAVSPHPSHAYSMSIEP